MYTVINIVKELEPAAESFIIENDRMLFKPFLLHVELFCNKHSILIGGQVGIDLLVGRPLTRDSFQWDLYTDDAHNMARQLADELYMITDAQISPQTVALITDVKYKEFTLRISARMVLKIMNLDKYRGVRLIDVIGPTSRPGYFSKRPVKLISEEVQLISVYRNLYTPKKIATWETDILIEDKLYNIIKDSIAIKATTIVGGALHHITQLTDRIVDTLLKNSQTVVVGDYALVKLGLIKNVSRLQFITSEDIQSLCDSIEKCIKRKITYINYPLNIISDFQITRYTIYVNDGKSYAIADVYNSTEFEMIPFLPIKNLKIGTHWVLLRFLLIDIWVLKLINNISDSELIEGRISDLLNNMNKLRKVTIELLQTSISTLFPLDNYVGNYYDEVVAKKKLIKEIGDKLPIYYPYRRMRTGSATTFVSRNIDLDAMSNNNELLARYNSRAMYGAWSNSPPQTNNGGITLTHLSTKTVIPINCCSGQDKAITINIPDEPISEAIISCAHHIMNLAEVINSISRSLLPGATLVIQDYDITTENDAARIDYQHFLSDVDAGRLPLDELINYAEINPMTYYNYNSLIELVTRPMLEFVSSETVPDGRIYKWIKTEQKN